MQEFLLLALVRKINICESYKTNINIRFSLLYEIALKTYMHFSVHNILFLPVVNNE